MANATLDAFARFKVMGDQLQALEERAGIAKKAEDARLGPMFPNLDATPDEYFRDAEDLARRKMRRLYFAVEDLDLRKELIRKRREFDRERKAHLQGELAKTRQALTEAEKQERALPWLQFRAGCVAALFVAVGAYFFQLYGAIGGALIGFFAAQGLIANARTALATAVRVAQAELDLELEGAREIDLRPDWFNASEERTGECDKEFDLESVLTNYCASKRTSGHG